MSASKTPLYVGAAMLVVLVLLAALLWAVGVFDAAESDSDAKVIAAVLALAGVAIAQVVAFIGLLLKHSIDERTLVLNSQAEARARIDSERNLTLKTETEARLRIESERNAAMQDQDRVISRVKTAREMFDYLASSDPRAKESALVLIAELGDPQLASRLASIYKREGGMGALARLTTSSGTNVAREAEKFLTQLSWLLEQSVVQVRWTAEDGSKWIASGFATHNPHLVFAAKAIRPGRDRGQMVDASIRLSNSPEQSVPANIVGEVDIGPEQLTSKAIFLRVDGHEFEPLPLGSTDDLSLGDPVQTLFFRPYRPELAAPSTGWFDGRMDDGRLLVAGLDTERLGGFGAPLVDRSGRVIGMHFGAELNAGKGLSSALPVEQFGPAITRSMPLW